MKKLFLFLAIFTFSFSFTQDKTYTMAMDSLLSHVDKTTMATGILYDRVFSYTDLNTNTTPPISHDYFLQVWNELHTSSLSPGFMSADVLQELIDLQKKDNKVILGMLNLKMNYLDYGPPSNPKLTFSNGYFWNVPGKNPFLQKTIQLAYPLVKEINSANTTFVISPEFIAQDNNSSLLNSIYIDFGNGVSYSYNVSGNFRPIRKYIEYASPGMKTVYLQMNYADNSTKSLQFNLTVDFEINSSKSSGTFAEFENFTGSAGINQTKPYLFRGIVNPLLFLVV